MEIRGLDKRKEEGRGLYSNVISKLGLVVAFWE